MFLTTLQEWVISVIGEPKFHEVFHNPNYTSGYGNQYTVQQVQYDWSFIASAVIFIVCLWGFISIIRMIFGKYRRH